MSKDVNKREQWKSQYGFIVAALGSAIGLGNIWRFPYMAYDNGGGAFLIPYLIALATAGIPLLILEFGIGHERVGSAPLALAKYKKQWEWVGWWAIIFIMFGIELYYSVIISWCVNYFKMTFTKEWGSNPSHFFEHEFLNVTGSPGELGNIQIEILIGLAIVWFVSWIIVYRGVSKGIELANKIFIPLLMLLMIILVVRSLFLDGAMEGLEAYFIPKYEKLKESKIWLDAFSQVFFSLSLGFGIMITYASYLPKKTNLTRAAFVTSLLDSGFAIFSGVAIFAVLGFMANSIVKTSGIPFEMAMKIVVKQGIGLAFIAYPEALNEMPGYIGTIFGILFFLSLVVAGLSSAISIIEAFVSAVIDKFQWNRKILVTITCIVGFLGGIVFTTGGGIYWLDIVDHFLNSYGLVTVGLLECIVVGWFFRIEILQFHINQVSSIKIGKSWNWMIRIFVPIVLTVIIGTSFFNEIQKPYENYNLISLLSIGVGWLFVTVIIAVVLSFAKWKFNLSDHYSRSDEYEIY
ncbi:MAG: sodium-dependent transporter [Spirochaetota bacterium]|nr:sodium-dependent transporter [Spirochaetota bacterium]